MASAAARAVALAPGVWETQAVQGWVLLSYHDFVAADRAFETALDLPKLGEASPLNSIATYLAQVGRLTESLAEHRLSQRIDPLYLLSPWVPYYLGRRDEALAEWERNKELQPGHPDSWSNLFFDMEQSDPAAMNVRLAGTPLAGLWGLPDEFLAILRPMRDAEIPRLRGTLAVLAMSAAHHGDTDLALEFLRAEYLADGFGAYFMIWSPALREVRTLPGFKTFVRDLGLLELWRTTRKWGDFCHPIGDDDFECT
jgi:tetratricopeptide (TPR) repeat protein